MDSPLNNMESRQIAVFEEYDNVYSVVDIDEKVSAGTKGVIVLVLDPEKGIYKVEFVDVDNETIVVIEVVGVQRKEICLDWEWSSKL